VGGGDGVGAGRERGAAGGGGAAQAGDLKPKNLKFPVIFIFSLQFLEKITISGKPLFFFHGLPVEVPFYFYGEATH
jgi:hypothetical protein